MIGLALSFALAAADADNPLAPAFAGKVQCYQPDVARRTCASIAAYSRLPDGSIDNRAVVLVSKSPVVVMETHSPVAVKGGAVCGPLTQHDIDVATFKVSGAPANAQQVALLRAALTKQMTPMFGHEACTTYVPAGDHMVAHARLEGGPTPPDVAVTWVSEADYQVAP